MEFRSSFNAILLGSLLFFLPALTQAQDIAPRNDTLLIATLPDTDTTQQKRFFLSGLKNMDRPGRAALYSAIIPGGGQIYNRSYWKVPIIYAGGGVLGYFLWLNNSNYQSFRYAALQRAESEQLEIDPFDDYKDHRYYGVDFANGYRNLLYARDTWRRSRDLLIIVTILSHGLTIAEAYVHAHLKDFDVSDNLSLRIQPNLINIPATTSYTTGLTLTLYTR